MSILAAVLLWLLVGALALLLAVIAVPLHVEARGAASDERLHGRAQVRWGWWVLVLRADSASGIDARVLGLRVWRFQRRGRGAVKDRAAKDKAVKAKEKPARREKARRPRKKRGAWRAWRSRYGLRRAIGAVLRTIPVRGRLEGTIGLSDPADTAALFGALAPLSARSEALVLTPDWLDTTLAIEGRLRVRVWPAHILGALLALVVTDGRARRDLMAMLRSKG